MKYPKMPSEKTCINEKRMMDAVRKAYYEKLIDERQAAQRILDKNGATSGAA